MTESKETTENLSSPGTLSMRIAEPSPLFPTTLSIDGVTISLKADGSYDGDGDAMLAAIAKLSASAFASPNLCIIWLVANAIRQEKLSAALWSASCPSPNPNPSPGDPSPA
jgi:hypothetical protein